VVDRQLLPWPVTSADSAAVMSLATAVRAALDGSGPALAVVGPTRDASEAAGRLPDHVPATVALVARTSGSTGRPRWVLLDRSALLASALATQERLGGPGHWVLALPSAHVAGLQVIVRSVLGDDVPTVVDGDGFTATALAGAVDHASRAAGGARCYTSLVPTQLHRVLAATGDAGLPPELVALTRLDAILVGGAATPPPLLARARAVGLRVVTTYGMTETCGGCVYDGVPLGGVRVAVDDSGVVRITGPVLARGYLPDAAPAQDDPFVVLDGQRWLRTADLGELHDGRLHLRGRRDDVVVTGGVKVRPADVEAVLAAQPGVAEVCVVGLPDPEWGQVVTAVLVPTGGASGAARDPTGPVTLGALRSAVTRTLGSAAAPRRLVLVDALPLRGPGKVDRSAVAQIAGGTNARH